MSDIKRFEDNGEFCLYSDYEKLNRQYSELKDLMVKSEAFYGAQARKQQATIDAQAEKIEDLSEAVKLMTEMDVYLNHGYGTSIYHDSIYHAQIKSALNKLKTTEGE